MSKFETIAHPQQLSNEFSGCRAVRRNLSFFDLFNVDDLVHSNNLLTHTHTHTHTHTIDTPTVYHLHLFFSLLCACVMRCHTSIQRGIATHYPFCFRMPVF